MPVATLIGDVVSSRRAGDRDSLHARLEAALAEVNQAFSPVTPLRITIGDEYQGAFASLGEALQATLRLRLAMLPAVDVRHGIGWGEVQVLQQQPRVEDGPGWWAARDAIEAVKVAEARPATRFLRTGYLRAGEDEGPESGIVEAALTLRDQMVGALSGRSVAVLRALLAGSTQREAAEKLEITASAVSQRVRAGGLAALVAADARMGALRIPHL